VRVGPNWKTGELGFNAFEAWCLKQSWPIVKVPTERDMGVDGFVQVTTVEGLSTGEVFGVQVKAGPSYVSATGGRVPVDRHGAMWREGTIPTIVVVHDPSEGALWWGNATVALIEDPSRSSVVAPHRLLDDDPSPLLRSVRLTSGARGGIPAGLGSDDPSEQCDAVWLSFALGFVTPKAMVGVRRMLRHLTDDASIEAIVALSHCTPHPDIFWSEHNRLPESSRRAIAATFRWSTEEILHLVSYIDRDENSIGRGSLGQCIYMLLYQDPDYARALTKAATSSADEQPVLAAWAAYLAVARSDDQRDMWEGLCSAAPALRANWIGEYIDEALVETGFIHLD
jgi:hypothetical protein